MHYGLRLESFYSGAATDCYRSPSLDQIGNIWEWVATDAEASVFADKCPIRAGLGHQVVNEGMSQEMPFATWIPLAGAEFESFEGEDGQPLQRAYSNRL